MPFEALRLATALAIAVSGVTATVGAAPADTASDQPTSAPNEARQAPKSSRFHDTLFVWDNSATTQTVGLGADYQSRDPLYEMMFRVGPRFYLFENPARDFSVRADVRLIREFTNSDTTTQRGEWTFADVEVWSAYVESLDRRPGHRTEFVLRAPNLVLPTSKVSYRNGRLFGLGFGLGLDHEVALRAGQNALLSKLLLRPRATYTYDFVDSNVTTNSGIDRIRMDPDGRSLPSDQLTGSAQPQHVVNLSLRTDTSILENLRFISEAGMRYQRRYALTDPCVQVPTGCAAPESSPAPTRWDVTTLFSAGVYYAVTPSAEVGVGYANASLQLGADGRRRGFFYSPDARVFLTLTVGLSEFYREMRHETPATPAHVALVRPGSAL